MRLSLCAMFIGLSSCATIVNAPTQQIAVHSPLPNARIQVNDKSYLLPAIVGVRRSKHDLTVNLIADTVMEIFKLRPSLNQSFLFGNVCTLYGYVVDLTNPKRFYYANDVVLNPAEPSRVIDTPLATGFRDFFTATYPDRQGTTKLNFSIPYVNGFHFNPSGESTRIRTGFWGLSLGCDYYHHDRKFINIAISAATNLPVPFPAPIDRFGPYEFMNSLHLVISDNFKYRRLTAGYGLSFARNTWGLTNEFSDPEIHLRKRANALGGSINTYFQATPKFHVGLLYRPTFIHSWPNWKFQYEHLISLDLCFKTKLRGE